MRAGKKLAELAVAFALSIFFGPENARALWELARLLLLKKLRRSGL